MSDAIQAGVDEAVRLLNAKQPVAAVAVCERIMPRLMKNPDALRLYAICLLEANQYNKAIATIDKAVRLRPMDPHYINSRGKILSQAGRYEQAITEFQRTLAIQPTNTEALDGSVEALRHLRRDREATEAIETALDSSVPVDGFFARAFAEAASGAPSDRVNADRAIEIIDEVLGSATLEQVHRTGLLFKHAGLLDKAGRYDEAFDALDRANKSTPVTFEVDSHRRATDQLIGVWKGEQLRPVDGAPLDHHVFIVGMPRSGSTLIERILAASPDVASAGETISLPAAAHELGIDQPPFRYVTNPALIDEARLPGAAATYTKRVREQAKAKSEGVIVDKLLVNAFFVPLAAVMFPNARFIGCLRDPRDVGLSCFQQDFGNSNRTTYDLANIAHYQADVLRVMHHWAEVLPDRFTLVEYESVVGDLDAAARSLSAAAGIEFSDRSLRYWESSEVIRTASYAQASKPIYTSSIGRWKNYEKHLGPLIDTLEQRGVSLR